MDERRKYKRLPIHLEIMVDHVFRQDHEVINGIDAEIELFNISKSGIGFYSQADMPLNFYFNAKIEFDEKRFFYCVLKIVRKEQTDNTYQYGCEFIGLAEFLSKKVDEYEALLEE